ncbi:serine hydrolase [Dermacoccaceae bacterium W4C1]
MSVQWSVLVQPLDPDPAGRFPEPWLSQDPDAVLHTASVGKLVVLAQAARRLAEGTLDPAQTVRKSDTVQVSDSGVWDHLDQPELSVLDLCRLVGLASDNLATNAVIDVLGLEAVQAYGEQLELPPLMQYDYVREGRDPSQPGVAEVLSKASASSLIHYFGLLHTGVIDDRVRQWLALDTDTSMVASAFGTDPLAHTEPDRGLSLAHKTGTEQGIRCDTGIVSLEGVTVGYAALANWQPQPNERAEPDTRDEVLARMNEIGAMIRRRLVG